MDHERWQHVARLYEAVREMPPAARSAFLARQSEDDELRREVESLLKHDTTPILLDRPILEAVAAVLVERFDLTVGTCLGPYRIDGVVGAGGMGQVYRAMDTRLNRTVAIKVLPKAYAKDSQFRARFGREAQAIAALTHPHICTLHDVGGHEGIDFLVMEYLEGETLATRLDKGPLSLEVALSLAIDVADALAAAHRLGIVHRDLKPGNIMLTRSGAKLLDFGLAKPVSAVVHGRSEPRASSLTGQGRILGTVQYMAPEQLEGRATDARTDIFAFGAVLYEMLTRKKAFEGKSQAGVIAAIMQSEPPDVAASQPLTPPALDRVVRTCLAKDPDDRWQSARDLSRELRWVQRNPIAADRTKRHAARWATAGLVAAALITLIIFLPLAPAPTQNAVRFKIEPPPGTAFPAPGQPYSPTISPDGTRLVFQVVRDGQPLLAARTLDALESQTIPGTEGAHWPFWSPDGRTIAFFAAGKLMKINAAGGPAQTICEVPSGWGGSWNRDDVIVFLRSETDGFYQVSATGGTPTPVGAVTGERFNGRPQFLPDGRRFIYGVSPDSVYLASLDGGPSRRVLTGTPSALYAAPDHLFFFQGTTLVVQQFDPDLSHPVGEPVPVGEGISGPILGAGGLAFSASLNGVLAYRSVLDQITPDRLGWFDRAGNLVEQVGPFPFERFVGLAASRDGKRIAVQSPPGQGSQSDIWIHDVTRATSLQLTLTHGADRSPVWSPDGQRVAFASLRSDAPGLYIKAAAGDRPEELLLAGESRLWEEHWPTDWSPAGILFESGRNRESIELWMLPVDGDRKPYPVVVEPGVQVDAKLSPGGWWVAYTERDLSDRSKLNASNVFVQNLATKAKRRVSTDGGSVPRWGADGKDLFYVAGDGHLMVAPVKEDATNLQLGAALPLFQTQLPAGGGRAFEVSPDGQRFLLRIPDRKPTTGSIVVLSNWPALVRNKDN